MYILRFAVVFLICRVSSQVLKVMNSEIDRNSSFEASRFRLRKSQQKERIQIGDEYFKLENCLKRNREFRSYSYDDSYRKNEFAEPPLIDERYYQHIALIGWNSTKKIVYYCTGVLITTRFVLTPSYCSKYTDYTTENLNGSATHTPNIVRLGDLDMTTSDDDKGVQQHPISRVITNNSITLLKLQAYIRKTLKVVPACLNDDPTDNFKTHLLRSAHYTEQVSDNIYGIGGVAIDLIESWEELEPQATCKDQNSWNSIYNFRPESDECLKPFPKKNSFDPYDQNVTCKDGGFLQYHRDEIQENVWYHDPVVIGLAHLLPSGCPSLIKSYTKIAPYIDWIESIVVKKRFKDEDMSRTFEM